MEQEWRLARGDYEMLRHRRRDFRAFLAECDSADSDCATPELIFGELVTNAVRYGRDPMSVKVAVREGVVEILVDTSGDCFDLFECLARQPTTSGGRGLQIVRALAETLNVERSEAHPCRVTARLRLEERGVPLGPIGTGGPRRRV